jgi:branched-chain amino acid aminotransferase
MSFTLEKSFVYFRKGIVPFSSATISIASSPVLYGLAVYTVFNVRYDKKNNCLYIFRLKDHYKRLVASARITSFTDFSELMSYEMFETTMIELLKKNHIHEDVLVRASLFIDELVAGTKSHGLTTSFSAYIYPMGKFYPDEGVHVCVSSWQRTSDNAIPSRAKINGSYANASLMKNEAVRNGYDEAIALDGNGHVTEGTVANIFMVRDGVLITPDQSADILEGITRDSVLQLAQQAEIPVTQRAIDRSELYIADELFYCGSSARITTILSVDKKPVGSGKTPVTEEIASLYEQAQMNKNSLYEQWVAKVKIS